MADETNIFKDLVLTGATCLSPASLGLPGVVTLEKKRNLLVATLISHQQGRS